MPLDLEKVRDDISQEKFIWSKEKKRHRFLLVLMFLVGLENFLFFFIIGGAVVNGSSMYPEIEDGDFVFYSRINQAYDLGDIVVIHDGENERYIIKRVIALEGDVVELTRNGSVMINGVRLDEVYVQRAPTIAQDIVFPQTVPPGRIFVLGDNRLLSKDSRNSAIGMVAEKDVRGTLLFILRFS